MTFGYPVSLKKLSDFFQVKMKAVKSMHKAYPWQATFIAPYSIDIATHKNNTSVEDPADEPNFNCTPVQKNGMEKSNGKSFF
jgi:hypothetical protein